MAGSLSREGSELRSAAAKPVLDSLFPIHPPAIGRELRPQLVSRLQDQPCPAAWKISSFLGVWLQGGVFQTPFPRHPDSSHSHFLNLQVDFEDSSSSEDSRLLTTLSSADLGSGLGTVLFPLMVHELSPQNSALPPGGCGSQVCPPPGAYSRLL